MFSNCLTHVSPLPTTISVSRHGLSGTSNSRDVPVARRHAVKSASGHFSCSSRAVLACGCALAAGGGIRLRGCDRKPRQNAKHRHVHCGAESTQGRLDFPFGGSTPSGTASTLADALQAEIPVEQDLRSRRREMFTSDSLPFSVCPGCGADFQTSEPTAPGYIPDEQLPQAPKGGRLTAAEEAAMLLEEEGIEEVTPGVSTASSSSASPWTLPTRKGMTRWRVVANVFLDIRKEPDINSEKVGKHVSLGDILYISDIVAGEDGRRYLRLGDGRGWIFDIASVRGRQTLLVEPVIDEKALLEQRLKATRQRVCLRCWQLWQHNDCDDCYNTLSERAPAELSPRGFSDMLAATLRPLKPPLCFIAVVDVFDFGSSLQMLEQLNQYLMSMPAFKLFIVANKMDLLPESVNRLRVQSWVMRQARGAGLKSVQFNDILPISCHRATGMRKLNELLADEELPRQFVFVGAANAGKSSLINLLTARSHRASHSNLSKVAHEQDGYTVSYLPGTTLAPQVMSCRRYRAKIIDTPGLVMKMAYQRKLSLEDLKALAPQTGRSHYISQLVKKGKAFFIGGLARIEHLSGEPFLFTAFASSQVKFFVARTDKVEQVYSKYLGEQLTPPMSTRTYERLGTWTSRIVVAKGDSMEKACCDIVLPGIGWVALTGLGTCTAKVHVPEGLEVSVRQDPLMPYEGQWATGKLIAPGVAKRKNKLVYPSRHVAETDRRRRASRNFKKMRKMV